MRPGAPDARIGWPKQIFTACVGGACIFQGAPQASAASTAVIIGIAVTTAATRIETPHKTWVNRWDVSKVHAYFLRENPCSLETEERVTGKC